MWSIFIQGAAGDVNPRVVGGLDGYQDDINVTWALGEEIGAEVVRVYASLAPSTPRDPKVQLETKEILLPRQYRELFDDFNNTTVKVPSTAVRICDMMWVVFPGEMFNGIGTWPVASTSTCSAPGSGSPGENTFLTET